MGVLFACVLRLFLGLLMGLLNGEGGCIGGEMKRLWGKWLLKGGKKMDGYDIIGYGRRCDRMIHYDIW